MMHSLWGRRDGEFRWPVWMHSWRERRNALLAKGSAPALHRITLSRTSQPERLILICRTSTNFEKSVPSMKLNNR